jgi:hypothetical protein
MRNSVIKTLLAEINATTHTLFWLRDSTPQKYQPWVEFGQRYARGWDEPEFDSKL